MNTKGRPLALYGLILILSLIAPWLLPAYQTQLAFLWIMVVFALTWDIVGGQMGYNSFGNVVFFGLGMYATAVIQRNLHFDLEEYAHVAGRVESLSAGDYLTGLFLGMGFAAVFAVIVAAILGACILGMGMRGQYFGICTLGLTVAAGELASGWEYIGAGSGLVTPVFPDQLGERGLFFYYLFFVVAVFAFLVLRWVYAGRFGLAINAIRDDEDKAEAMGIHTTRYKITAWCISAFFSFTGRRRSRSSDRLYRPHRCGLCWSHLRGLDDSDGDSGRQRHPLGPGDRGCHLSYYPGAVLEPVFRLATGGAGRDYRGHRGFFPHGSDGLDAGALAGAVR